MRSHTIYYVLTSTDVIMRRYVLCIVDYRSIVDTSADTSKKYTFKMRLLFVHHQWNFYADAVTSVITTIEWNFFVLLSFNCRTMRRPQVYHLFHTIYLMSCAFDCDFRLPKRVYQSFWFIFRFANNSKIHNYYYYQRVFRRRSDKNLPLSFHFDNDIWRYK